MATLHPGVVLVKGAAEVVLGRCGDAPGAGDAIEGFAEAGMRVLAVAERRVGDDHVALTEADIDGGFTLLGLAALVDPPRESALAAVHACRDAGIGVKMITGDHVSTARAIAARFGLTGRAFSGRELDAIDDDGLDHAAAEGVVFARVAPEHKLRLVRALQARGHVVAMTGDGVNDAPALKQADVGVAMGASGTAAAREAADVVLTDDDFASIEAAVEEGRHVFDNVQKAIAFVLPTNLGEALIVLLAVLFFPFENGLPRLPVEPTQILWVNLIATVTLALPLAVEALEPGVMSRSPRKPGAPVLGPFLLGRTIMVTLLMTVAGLGLFALRDDQTLVVTTIVLFQVVYLLECRSLRHSNPRCRRLEQPLGDRGDRRGARAPGSVRVRPAAPGGVRLGPDDRRRLAARQRGRDDRPAGRDAGEVVAPSAVHIAPPDATQPATAAGTPSAPGP
jgi:magnesium-transporting ATPase (P-type)